MAWNIAHPSKKNKYCDLKGYIDLYKVGCILICEHAYYFGVSYLN